MATTILAGASSTVTIPQNYRLDLTGNCTVTYGPGPLSSQTQVINLQGSIGPFSATQAVYITAATPVGYVISPTVLNPARLPVWAGDIITESADGGQLFGANGFTKVRPQLKKAPSPSVGQALALSDVTALTGSPSITLEAGPNGQPAIKIVTGVSTTTDIQLNGMTSSVFYGDAYISLHGSRTQGNIDFVTFYVSQTDALYTNGASLVVQYGQAAPLNGYLEQGGANTYYVRKAALSPIGSPTYPMPVGQMKLRIAPLAGTAATVYLYGFGTAAPAPKGRICVTWDDGYDSMFKLGYEAFASRGIKQTLSVIGSAQDFGGTFSYTRQLKAFVDAGNACVAHGPWPNQGAGNLYSAYPGSTNPVADAVADMARNREWLRANGLLVPNADRCYVWPQGQFQAAVNDTTLLDAAIAAGFTVARGTSNIAGSGIYGYGTNADALSKYNKMAMPIVGHLWAGTTAAEATNIAAITTAISNLSSSRADAFLMLHRVLPSSTNDAGMGAANNITIRQSDLETIAAAIKTQIDAGTLEAVTMPELAANSWWQQF